MATVPFFDPQGNLRDVPSAMMDKALANGGKKATLFNAPDGKQRWVPSDKIQEAVQHGGWGVLGGELTTNTINPATGTGYGLYRVLPPADSGFTRSEDEKQVPFNRVEKAIQAGWHLHPDEQARYEKDKTHPDSGPTLLESLGTALEPSQGAVGQIPITPLFDVNAAKAAGRVAYGTPGFLKDLAVAYYKASTGGAQDVNNLFNMVDPFQVPEQLQKQFHEDAQTDPKLAFDNLVGSLAGMALLAAATHGATKEVPELAKAAVKKPLEHVRGAVRDTLGVPEDTERIVDKFGKKSEVVRQKNVKETEANRQAKIDALRDRKEAETKHAQQVDEVRNHNEAVLRDRAKRTDTQEKLDTASKELDGKIAEAQKKAKEEDDAAWQAWRDKVGNAQVDMTSVTDEIKAQEDKMNPQQVAEFRDILKNEQKTGGGKDMLDTAAQQAFGVNYDAMTAEQKTVVDADFAQRGIDVNGGGGGADTPISRLHGWKTQLEDAVRSDRAGNVKYAIGQVLDTVRKLEEQVSKEAGADDLLKKARELHGPYVDTFRNAQSTPGTMANYVRSKVTPNFTKDMRLEDYLTNLGHYDPSIPKLSEHISNLEQGLKALPKEQPLREQIKPLPPAPEPEKFEPKPLTPMPKTPNLQAENLKYINTQLRKYGRWGSWVLRLLVGGVAEHMAHGNLSAFGGELAIGQAGVTLLTKALRSPSVLEWLAKSSAEDMKVIATLSPEDAAKMRDVLNRLADEDAKKNPKLAKLKIAPMMAAFLAGGQATRQQSVQDLKKQSEQLKPTPPAPGPQGSTAKPTWTHIYDPQTNSIVPV